LADTLRHNDQPITQPSEDLYGFDPFAKAIASGIRKMPAPNGYVLAINGPCWGAGKSSVINLVLHHLADEATGGSIKLIRFTPWWFSGEEALAEGAAPQDFAIFHCVIEIPQRSKTAP
jgi:predicted KAP-like P-loop ATPase